MKLAAFVVHACNPFADNGGIVFKFEGEGEHSLRRYARYAMDLDKPMPARRASLGPCVYPFMFSPTSMGMCYVWGPYAMLSVLHCFVGPLHLTTRTDVLSTEPAYHNHATVFFNASGAGYHHYSFHTLGPWAWFYRSATSRYASSMGARVRDSEERSAAFATPTFAGRLLQDQFDPPPFELLWQPGFQSKDQFWSNGPLRPRGTPMPAFQGKAPAAAAGGSLL